MSTREQEQRDRDYLAGVAAGQAAAEEIGPISDTMADDIAAIMAAGRAAAHLTRAV